MILELLNKEHATYDRFSFKKRSDVVSALLRLAGWLLFLWLEWYLFHALDVKISAYSPYGSFDFLVFFLALSLGISTIAVALKGRQVFFAKTDRVLLFALPVDEFELVFSKVLYLFAKMVALNTLLCLPLIFLYGNEHALEAPYYVLSLFYGLLLSLALIAPACLLAFVLEGAHRLLANREWAQLLLASALCVGACFLYRYVLDAFLGLLVNAEVGGLFSMDFLSGLHAATPYLVPAYSLLALASGDGEVLINLAFLFGSIVVSLFIVLALLSHLYVYWMKSEHGQKKTSRREPALRLDSPQKALLKKELILLFRDSGNTFSYSALLVMEPFLAAVVLKSLQSVLFYNLQGLLSYFSGIAPAVNLAILLLFAGVISASGAQSFGREKANLALLKSLPIEPRTILLSKLAVPTFFSSLAFLVSLIVALTTGLIDLPLFFLALFLGLLLIVTENLAGLKDNIDSLISQEESGGALADLLGALMPLFYGVLYAGLSLLNWPWYALGAILLAVALLLLGSFLFHGAKPYEQEFALLEVN